MYHQDPDINIFVETWVGLEFSPADLDVLLQHHWPDVGRVVVLPLKQVDFARGKAHNTHTRVARSQVSQEDTERCRAARQPPPPIHGHTAAVFRVCAFHRSTWTSWMRLLEEECSSADPAPWQHSLSPPVRTVQGGQVLLRLPFVDKKLVIPSLLPSCYAISARFPPAQAGLGRLSNIPQIN